MKALLLFLSMASAHAQQVNPQELSTLDINLSDFCKGNGSVNVPNYQPPHAPLPTLQQAFSDPYYHPVPVQKESFCDYVQILSDQQTVPIRFKKQDRDGNPWQINFYFGYVRSKYENTNIHLKSSRIDVVIKDFEFDERTSSSYYDVSKWKNLKDATMWIHEPTNSFTLSASREQNVIYFTITHPKFLRADYQSKEVTGTIDGRPVNSILEVSSAVNAPAADGKTPELQLDYFGNTRLQLDWQLGYGRQFKVADWKKLGSVYYTVRADAGITTGKNQSLYADPNDPTQDDVYFDRSRYQGINGSIGHRLEYRVGRVTAFINQKETWSSLHHGFFDGSATYNMRYSQVNVGLGIRLFKIHPKDLENHTPARVDFF